MRIVALLVTLALTVPVAAQDTKTKKPAAGPAAHAKPTPQQIRKFNELEKKEQKKQVRGRSPNSGPSPSQSVRAPSPK